MRESLLQVSPVGASTKSDRYRRCPGRDGQKESTAFSDPELRLTDPATHSLQSAATMVSTRNDPPGDPSTGAHANSNKPNELLGLARGRRARLLCPGGLCCRQQDQTVGKLDA